MSENVGIIAILLSLSVVGFLIVTVLGSMRLWGEKHLIEMWKKIEEVMNGRINRRLSVFNGHIEIVSEVGDSAISFHSQSIKFFWRISYLVGVSKKIPSNKWYHFENVKHDGNIQITGNKFVLQLDNEKFDGSTFSEEYVLGKIDLLVETIKRNESVA